MTRPGGVGLDQIEEFSQSHGGERPARRLGRDNDEAAVSPVKKGRRVTYF